MDLHKIIHNTLHEFIKIYITDADLRLAITSLLFVVFLQPYKKVRFTQIYMKLFFYPQCSTLDDVLLSYITGVLEDLGSQQSVEENFDVEVFAEMLEAYIPGFADIDR